MTTHECTCEERFLVPCIIPGLGTRCLGGAHRIQGSTQREVVSQVKIFLPGWQVTLDVLQPTYYRQDITYGKSVIPLTLTLVDVSDSCAAAAGAVVIIWHCNKDCIYSEYATAIPGRTTRGFRSPTSSSSVSGAVLRERVKSAEIDAGERPGAIQAGFPPVS